MGSVKYAAVLLALSILAQATHAVNTGDDANSEIVDGAFLAFADRTIHVVNPQNLSIASNITTDQSGNPFNNAVGAPRVWNDVVFQRNPAVRSGLAFVNEGDVYTVNGATVGYTTVIQTGATPKVVGRVQVGGRPVSLFQINSTNSVWTRSGADGKFYIISVTSLSPFNATVKSVNAYTNKPDTGVLVVSPSLSPVAYATNVAEPTLFKYDLITANLTGSFSFSSAANCTGANTAVYSPVNSHVYAECVNNGGVLEWDTVADRLVGQHGVYGVLRVTPNGDRVLVTDMLNSSSTLLAPGANGQRSTIDRVLSVPGLPDQPAFYSNATITSTLRFQDYNTFFPLARNTQKYLVRSTNDAIASAAYYNQPSDCQYANSTVSAASIGPTQTTGLRLATAANGTVLTPQCGACAPGIGFDIGNITNFYYQLGGFDALPFGSPNATFVFAGAIQPNASFSSTANQCSFARPSRAAVRGGNFVATVADLPQSSLYVVPGNSPTNSVGFVYTANKPRKVVWAPTVTF